MFTSCGGNDELFSCFQQCKNCPPGGCNQVCPRNADDFAARMVEVGGFRNTFIRSVTQIGMPNLPRYIPVIYSKTGRCLPLRREMTAVPFWRIIGGPAKGYELLVESESDLREKFLIAESTKFLVVGAGFDSKLENFWCNLHRRDLLARLPSLGVTAVTTPNFSFFTDMMGPTKMYNFRRILLATQALSEAGVTPIPHLNALTSRDWENWYSFLKDQSQIRTVAKEFATGLAQADLGVQELHRLANVQEKLGYPLHLVAMGGSQFARNLNTLFPGHWSITDADPFIKTVKRQVPCLSNGVRGWRTEPLPKNSPLDQRLNQNIQFAEDVLNDRFPPVPVVNVPLPNGQLELAYAW